MTAVNGFTAAHMQALADENITDGHLSGSDLILVQRDLTEINAGNVRGNVFARKTVNYTLVLSDVSKFIEMDLAGANTLTIPLNATAAIPIGSIIQGSQYGAGITTITPETGSVLLRSRGGLLATNGQYARFKMEKVGTEEWYISGDLA